MNKKTVNAITGLILLIMTGLLPGVCAAATYPTLEAAIKSGDYDKAWKRAQQLRERHEGEPRFDYLYGVAALETGHADEAVFALDRVTIVEPRLARARLELARAYLQQENYPAAKQQFSEALALNPPATVRQKIDLYMQKIDAKDLQPRRSLFDGYVTVYVGHDNNVNAGVEDLLISYPVLGTVTLSPGAAAVSDAFGETRLALNYQYRESADRIWFTRARLSHREYFDGNNFDLTYGDLRGGLLLPRGNRQYQLMVRYLPISIGGSRWTSTLSLDVSIKHQFQDASYVAFTATAEDYNHHQSMLRDKRRGIISGTYYKAIGDYQHKLMIYFAHETPDTSLGLHLSLKLKGVEYRLTKLWDSDHTSYIGAAYRYAEHRATSPFGILRVDQLSILSLGHEWKVTDDTFLLFQASYLDNNSNDILYDYDKTQVKVGLRYSF
jgi:tetratricopeptide (TPR) repeat protein